MGKFLLDFGHLLLDLRSYVTYHMYLMISAVPLNDTHQKS